MFIISKHIFLPLGRPARLRLLHQRQPVRPPLRVHHLLLRLHHAAADGAGGGAEGAERRRARAALGAQGGGGEEEEPADQQDAHLDGGGVRDVLVAAQHHQLHCR